MTLEERLTAIKAEHISVLDEAETYKRLAAMHEASGKVAAGRDSKFFEEIARLRDLGDAACERAGELAHQIGEIESRLNESMLHEYRDLVAQIEAVRAQLDRLQETGWQANSLGREAEEQALRRQLQNLREAFLGAHGDRMALEYLGAARQLCRAAAGLRAFADLAGVFGVRLRLDVEDLNIPVPQGDRPILRSQAPGQLRVTAAQVLACKEDLTGQLAELLAD